MQTFYQMVSMIYRCWPKDLDINIFISILNNLNPSINFNFEAATNVIKNGSHVQELAFWMY